MFQVTLNCPVYVLQWSIFDSPCCLVGGGADGMISVWTLPSNPKEGVRIGTTHLPTIQFRAHYKYLSGLSFSPSDPNLLVSTSEDGFFKIWDLRTPFRPLFQTQFTGAIV